MKCEKYSNWLFVIKTRVSLGKKITKSFNPYLFLLFVPNISFPEIQTISFVFA